MLKDLILDELRRGDAYAGHLKEVCNTSYKCLWIALKSLEEEGKIKRYFKPTLPAATLTFSLVGKKSMSYLEGGIQPWNPMLWREQIGK